jgi:HAD superfamily hydrolase (TIGR01509 family)
MAARLSPRPGEQYLGLMANRRPILFDCDGVLVNSEVIAVAEETAALARFGLIYDRTEFVSRFMGLSDPDFFAALNADAEARLSQPLPEEVFAALKSAIHARYEKELVAINGAVELISAYRGPMAVASSSHLEVLRHKLRLTGLDHLFAPHIYSGEQVARAKPAPNLFLFAAAQLGVTINDCIIIEDSINGVRAGLAAGGEVWGFTGGGYADDGHGARLAATGAHHVFDTFAAMRAHLERTMPRS